MRKVQVEIIRDLETGSITPHIYPWQPNYGPNQHLSFKEAIPERKPDTELITSLKSFEIQ